MKFIMAFVVLLWVLGAAYWVHAEKNCDGVLVRTATGLLHCVEGENE